MSAADLLVEITQAFQDEPRPGEWDIVYSNASDDLEVIQIRDTFKLHTWQTIPDELLFYKRAALSFLSPQGFKYYLPAFLGFAVRDYTEADTIPDDLIHGFTLPTELDALPFALRASCFQLQEELPALVWEEYEQARLRNMNSWVHYFFTQCGQFSPAQGRVILHFLEYMRDEHGQDYWHDQPGIAIERYWFQFA